MKRLITFGLGMALFAGAASAQSVVIVDKDGVTHKFATDYVENITFAPVELAKTITFPAIKVNAYINGNCELTFTSEEDGIEVTLDTYCGSEATYLLPGDYTVAESGTEMYISTDPRYTMVKRGDAEPLSVVSGSMNVQCSEPNYDYAITFDLKLSDGSDVKGAWSGQLPAYGPLKKAVATSFYQLNLDETAPGEFYMKSNDANHKFEAVLDIIAPAGSATIPDGTYTLGDGETAGTYTAKSQIDFYNPYMTVKFTGPITFKTEGGVTKVTSTIYMDNGMIAEFYSDVAIEYLQAPQQPTEPVFKELAVTPYSNGNCELTFTSEEDGIEVTLDTYCGSEATYLLPGDYTVAESGTEMYISTNPRYTVVKRGDADPLSVVSGSMNVQCSEPNYDYAITFDLKLSDGSDVKGAWSGELPAYGPIKKAVATRFYQLDLDETVPGEFYMRSNDATHKFEAVLDIIAPAGSATIPDGTYTLGDGETAGTYTFKSQIDFHNPNMTAKFTGPVTFKTEGGVTKVTSTIYMDNGMIVEFYSDVTIVYVQ